MCQTPFSAPGSGKERVEGLRGLPSTEGRLSCRDPTHVVNGGAYWEALRTREKGMCPQTPLTLQGISQHTHKA